MQPQIDESVSDDKWRAVLDPRRVDTAKRQAEQHYGKLSSDEIEYLRKKAKNHLFFLTHGLLGYNKLSVNLHGHYASWIMRNRTAKRRIELLPRGHFKSTIETVGDTIQLVLPDVVGGQPFPYNLGPNARVLLGHETGFGASRFLFEITGHVTGNPKLIGLFPEIVPEARTQRMNKQELELPRDSFWAEPTIDTMGVGAKGQGRHYDLIKLDDIFGLEARESKAERDTCIEWFDNIEAFWISVRTGKLVIVGTRYSLDDVYAHAIKKYGQDITKYIRRVEEYDPKLKKAIPIFPEEFPATELVHLRKNRKTWIQYSNDPRVDANKLDQGWKRYYHRLGDSKIQLFAGTSSTIYTIRRDLDIYIHTDPAIDGLPGVVVVGVSSKLQVFVLEHYKTEMKPVDFINLLFRLVQRWWPRVVTIEEAVFGKVYQSWLQREMNIRGVRFNIIPIQVPRDKVKLERVAASLSNYFSAGQIFFDLAEQEHLDKHQDDDESIIWEYDNLGSTDNYHQLDALEQGTKVWRGALAKDQMERYAQLEKNVLAGRDPISGYSSQ